MMNYATTNVSRRPRFRGFERRDFPYPLRRVHLFNLAAAVPFILHPDDRRSTWSPTVSFAGFV